jgi:hypothetical protein
MPVSVVLSNPVTLFLKSSQDIEFVVEVVEDHQSGVPFENAENSMILSAIIVDKSPEQVAECTSVGYWFIGVGVESGLEGLLIWLLIVVYSNIMSHTLGVSSDRHVHQDLPSATIKNPRIKISLDLGELGEVVKDNMTSEELGSVSVESICDKQWDIVEPYISRSCG